jgi:hypothetical protein
MARINHRRVGAILNAHNGAMRVSDEQLDEFIRGYEATFKEPLSRDEARIMTGRLLELYRLFLRGRRDMPAAPESPDAPARLSR